MVGESKNEFIDGRANTEKPVEHDPEQERTGKSFPHRPPCEIGQTPSDHDRTDNVDNCDIEQPVRMRTSSRSSKDVFMSAEITTHTFDTRFYLRSHPAKIILRIL
jgi:hypothetical protein